MRHLIGIEDLSVAEIEQLIATAEDIMANPAKYSAVASGKKLATLEGEATRPTSERIKGAIFSSIQFELEQRVVLDLFAGSGQMGLEAVSRGANSATFIDDFEKMAALFGPGGVDAIEVVSGTSKAGREFITCAYAGV